MDKVTRKVLGTNKVSHVQMQIFFAFLTSYVFHR